MRLMTALSVLMFCTLAALPVHAQTTFSSLHVNGLPTVYVIDRTGQETRGKLVSFTESAIAIEVNGATRTFAADEVSLIERRGDSLKNGAIIGGAIGIPLGILGGAMSDCPDGDSFCSAGTRVGLALVGIAMYAAIGAGIDALISGRTRIWPGAARKTSGLTVAVSPQSRRAFVGWRMR